MTRAKEILGCSFRALKSGMRTSIPQSGIAALTARTVAAQWAEAASGRSSRATPVMTANLRPINLTASAILSGSSASKGCGLAVITSQKLHLRVQRSPHNRKVASRASQHS
jgi:hypothetical protein